MGGWGGLGLRNYAAQRIFSSMLPSTQAFCRLMLRPCWPAARYIPAPCHLLSPSPDIMYGSLQTLHVDACTSNKAPHLSLRPPWTCNRPPPPRPNLRLPPSPSPRYVTNSSTVRGSHHLSLYVCRHAPPALRRRSYNCRDVSSASPTSFYR